MIKHFILLKIKNMMVIKDVFTKQCPSNLAEELHKPNIRKFGKREVHSSFKDSIWNADSADIQLISNFNKRIRFLLCVTDIYGKYAWIITL